MGFDIDGGVVAASCECYSTFIDFEFGVVVCGEGEDSADDVDGGLFGKDLEGGRVGLAGCNFKEDLAFLESDFGSIGDECNGCIGFHSED